MRYRVDGDRVWLSLDGVGNPDAIEIVPSHRAWKKRPAYWRCRAGRRWLGPWRLTVALAIAAAGLGA